MSSSDATMTTAGAAESVGGGEAVGMPSLRQAASGLAAALSQGTTVAREASPTGRGTHPHRLGAIRRGSGPR